MFGGYGNAYKQIRKFDPKSKRCSVFDAEYNVWSARACTVDEDIYVVGGYLKAIHGPTGNILRWTGYDLVDTGMKLRIPRYYHCMVSYGNSIYVIGGLDDHGNNLNTCEVIHISTNQVYEMPSMKEKRTYAAATLVGDQIFVLGGYDDTSELNSVEVYDISTMTWSSSTSMTTERWCHEVIYCNGKIYVIGGNVKDIQSFIPNNPTRNWQIECKLPGSSELRSSVIPW